MQEHQDSLLQGKIENQIKMKTSFIGKADSHEDAFCRCVCNTSVITDASSNKQTVGDKSIKCQITLSIKMKLKSNQLLIHWEGLRWKSYRVTNW